MPIISTVDHALGEMHAVAVGPVNYADLEAHLQQEKRWNGLAYRELIDARGAGLIVTPAEIRRIAEVLRKLSNEAQLGRTAVIVSSDRVFALIEMLETQVEDFCQIKPFRDEEEAREWLAGEHARGAST